MEKLIAIEDLIAELKKEGINLGKGDPYNRLRYYTKIGLLPNMTRKKSIDGSAKGHYPAWVVQRVAQIEDLKDRGFTNEEIDKKISAQRKLANIMSAFKTPEGKNKLLLYTSIILLSLIFLVELDVIPIGKSKTQIITQSAFSIPNQIIDSGSAFMPGGKSRVFIKSNSVHSNSKIHVSFNNNYAPATRFWTSGKSSLEGFYVELDSPTLQDAGFNWWLSN